MSTTSLKSPIVYFGGKSWIASEVWDRFGDVRNFVDPFMGSMAMLLGRPAPFEGSETVNDADGLLCNFFRALVADPEAVAFHADAVIHECDLHARHAWLVGHKEDITRRLEGDPEWFDAKVAGWWAWGNACWIGSGWCSGDGPWRVVEGEDGTSELRAVGGGIRRKLPHLGNAGQGVNRQLPHLGNAGQGVNRQRPHLGDAGQGVNRQLPHLGDAGRGVNRQRPHLGDAGRGERLSDYFGQLADRLRRVRICCGDFARVLGPSVTFKHGLTAVILDPPYADTADRTAGLYRVDSLDVAHRAREWAIANGDNPLLRIALCGYDGEHTMPDSWECFEWKARGGFGSQGDIQGRANAKRERVWFSPNCLRPEAERFPLFASLEATP